MIKRIIDITFNNWHEDKVEDAIEELQDKGYEIMDIKKVSRMTWMFGQNITDIFYKKAE